jgi:hypothetical protein
MLVEQNQSSAGCSRGADVELKHLARNSSGEEFMSFANRYFGSRKQRTVVRYGRREMTTFWTARKQPNTKLRVETGRPRTARYQPLVEEWKQDDSRGRDPARFAGL